VNVPAPAIAKPALICLGAVLAVAVLPPRALAAYGPPAEPIVLYVAALQSRLPEPARHALVRIDGIGRRLLATRSYLRVGAGLVARWSWSEERIARYQESDESRAVLAEIDAILTRFAEQNPGYTLYVNLGVRSLETQLTTWNENASVGVAADAMLEAATREIRAYRTPPDAAAVRRFARWVEAWRPDPPPTLAAPGLSAHGQSRAFDFQVQQEDRLVAGTTQAEIATVWEAEGWTSKLAAAVAGSPHFRGPLMLPYEPWHYTYVPEPAPTPTRPPATSRRRSRPR
jgi:hypothetical protein